MNIRNENPLIPLLSLEDGDRKVPISLTINKKRRYSDTLDGLPQVHKRWLCAVCGIQLGIIYPTDETSTILFDLMDLNFICSCCQSKVTSPVNCTRCQYTYGTGKMSLEVMLHFICFSCINEANLICPPAKTKEVENGKLDPVASQGLIKKAKKAKKGRKYLQEQSYCGSCRQKDVLINYYSAKGEILEPNKMECVWVCTECGTDSDSLLCCGVCKRIQGSGSIKWFEDSNDSNNFVHLFPKREKGIDNDIVTQVVCPTCDKKWQICSECGGGGRMRTGKYRPVELFSAGRRTCRLSHIRLGTNITDLDCWSSNDPQKFVNFLHELRSVHEDSYLSMNALSELMENPEWPFKTFESLKNYTIYTFNELMNFMLTPLPHKRRYIAVAFGPKDDKKVVRASNNSSLILFNSEVHDKSIYNRRIIVGYACLEWEIGSPVLNLTNIVLRAINANSTLLSSLIIILVKKALKDHSLENSTVPFTVMVTKIRQEYTRILILAEKMGFTYKAKEDEADGYHSLSVPLLSLFHQERL